MMSPSTIRGLTAGSASVGKYRQVAVGGGKPREDIETPGDALHCLTACHLAQPAVLDVMVQPVGGVMQALLPGNLPVPIAYLAQEREECLSIIRPGKRQHRLD